MNYSFLHHVCVFIKRAYNRHLLSFCPRYPINGNKDGPVIGITSRGGICYPENQQSLTLDRSFSLTVEEAAHDLSVK